MSATITIRDETLSGESIHEFELELLTERLTVRELIRSRVYQEVQDFNTRRAQVFQGLVQPDEAEATLNGYALRRPRQIDWRKQFDRAIEAFEANRVLVLLDGRQLESLDEPIEIGPGAEVSFLRLMPLVGG
jgi:hypothetical protein